MNIGPPSVSLDYWAEVSEVEEQLDGSVEVTADLDLDAQKQDVELNEVSDEYEVLTFYGRAVQLDQKEIGEKRIPLSELENDQ